MAVELKAKFEVAKFLDDNQQVEFYKNLGENIWVDSNFLEKTWGYLHLRADLSSYHNNQYYIDRGRSFIEQQESTKVLSFFLKFINQSSLKEEIIEGFLESIPFDDFLKDEDENLYFRFRSHLHKLLYDKRFHSVTYKYLIERFVENISDLNKFRDSKEIKKLLTEILSKIFLLEKIKNELKLSSNIFYTFISKHLSAILSDDFSYHDFKESIEEPLKQMNDQYLLDSPKNKKDWDRFCEKIDDGYCYGLTMSLISKSLESQDDLDPEKTFAYAKFLQTTQEIDKLAESNNNEIGRKIVKNFDEFDSFLAIVYKKIDCNKDQRFADLKSFLAYIKKGCISFNINKLIGEIAKEQMSLKHSSSNLNEHDRNKIIDVINDVGSIDNEKNATQRLLKLKKIEILSSPFDSNHLYDKLIDSELPSNYKKFNLRINNGVEGHSIFISLNPISFCDQNDLNFNELKFRLRKFDSIEDMMICLMFLIEKTYEDYNFNYMQLNCYIKNDESF